MRYRIVKLICMFDLPVETPKQRRAYRIFRKKLIKEGFTMIQYSIYMRTCPNKNYAKRMESRVKKFIPAEGNIRLLGVTEKQYNDMSLLVGTRTLQEKVMNSERFVSL